MSRHGNARDVVTEWKSSTSAAAAKVTAVHAGAHEKRAKPTMTPRATAEAIARPTSRPTFLPRGGEGSFVVVVLHSSTSHRRLKLLKERVP